LIYQIKNGVCSIVNKGTAMSHAVSTNPKHCKVFLLGTSALVCLALAAPVMADDFVITGSDNSTNGTGTTNGGTAAAIADTAINGSDTVSLGITLTTTGTNNVGIQTSNVDNVDDGNAITVTEAGSISTTGTVARVYGIYNSGDDNTTTMSGSISTTGEKGYGIYNKGSDNTTIMSGSISTTGKNGYGIVYSGDDNTTTMSGSISTTGEYGFGIFNYGSVNTTTMSGSISTINNWGIGIHNQGDTNTLSMSGTIKTVGENAEGIRNTGNNNAVTVSGSVSSTGSSALSNHKGSGNSFTLDEGAVIIGDISALVDTTNNQLKFNLGGDASYAFTVGGGVVGTGAGQWDFSDLDRSSQVVTTSEANCASKSYIPGAYGTYLAVCNLVTAVGAANAEVQNELQYITSTSLINSLRLDTPVNTSQEETTATDVWFDAYGVSTERDASTWDTTGVVFNADTRGLTIGKPLVLGESFGLDLVFNTSQTDLDVGATKHQNIAAQSFNFGVVMTDLASSSNWDVDAFGFIGRNSYEGKRKVMNNQVSTGSETVTSSYSGTKALVGFDVDYTTPINEAVSFKGGINANLSNEKIGAYSESKYSTWNARTVSQAASGISVGLTHNPSDLLTTFVTLGAEYSSLLSGEKASYTNNGTATSYTDHDASDDMISSVAVGFKYAGTNGVSFEGSIKGSSSNKGLTSTSANFGLNWAF
tara:strand:- start:45 stop:2153 length:2109 start_codon:yes stop_codon:yes gene_type:complete